MVQFTGKYRIVNHDNMDQYLKAAGFGKFARKFCAVSTGQCVIEIVAADEQEEEEERQDKFWSLIVVAPIPMWSHKAKFRLGVPFHEKLVDGRTCQTVYTISGEERDELVQESYFTTGKHTAVRVFTDNGFTFVLKARDVVATGFAERI